MARKNLVGCIPVLFVMMIVGLYFMPKSDAPADDSDYEDTPEEVHRVEVPFEGRMVMPEASDFQVLDNSAGRDMELIAKFFKGRAAGLHWLSTEHFKSSTRKHPLPDVKMNVTLSVDSMGVFQVLSIKSSAKDAAMEEALQEHIKKYWRYRRSTSGKTEFVAPFTWTSKY